MTARKTEVLREQTFVVRLYRMDCPILNRSFCGENSASEQIILLVNMVGKRFAKRAVGRWRRRSRIVFMVR
jgi:hypothetical protein